jgi:hypothetical protein
VSDPRVDIVAAGYDRIADRFAGAFDAVCSFYVFEAAGLSILRDEVVTFEEPEGLVQFQWGLAQR